MNFSTVLTFATSGACGTYVRGMRALTEAYDAYDYRKGPNRHTVNSHMQKVLAVAAVADGAICALELAKRAVPASAKLALLGLRIGIILTGAYYDDQQRKVGRKLFETGGIQIVLTVGAVAEGALTLAGYAKAGRVCNLAAGVYQIGMWMSFKKTGP